MFGEEFICCVQTRLCLFANEYIEIADMFAHRESLNLLSSCIFWGTLIPLLVVIYKSAMSSRSILIAVCSYGFAFQSFCAVRHEGQIQNTIQRKCKLRPLKLVGLGAATTSSAAVECSSHSPKAASHARALGLWAPQCSARKNCI